MHSGVVISQQVANVLGNFDVQQFRLRAVSWLVDNNHPLIEFESPAFMRMMQLANAEAADALWRSHNSVSKYIMRLYNYLKPEVIMDILSTQSKVHFSFDR